MELLFTIGIFGVLMLGMAVGVIFSGKTLKGSCGGVGNSCPCEESGTPNACKVTLDSTGNKGTSPQYQQKGGVLFYE